MSIQAQKTYRIFLLTVWQEDEENWRFLMEDPRTGKRNGFADLGSFTDGLPEIVGMIVPEASQKKDDRSVPSPGG